MNNLSIGCRLHGCRLYAVAAAIYIGALVTALDLDMIATAVPQITSDFGDASNISWYSAAYTFAICAFTPLAGQMAWVLPLDYVYLFFTAILFVGTIVCGTAATNIALIVGRAIAGIGAAGVITIGMIILTVIPPPKHRAFFIGFAHACCGIGRALSPLLGGLINLPLIGITFAVIYLLFKPLAPNSQTFTKRFLSLDLVGCFFFIPAVIMLLLSLHWGGRQFPWGSRTINWLLGGAAVMMGVFVLWEAWQGDAALIPGTVVARQTVLFSGLFAFGHMASVSIATYYLPIWFQIIQGDGAIQSGVRLLPMVANQIFVVGLAGCLIKKIRSCGVYLLFACTATLISSIMFTDFSTSTTDIDWIWTMLLQGAGNGLGLQLSSLAVQLDLNNSADLIAKGVTLVIFLQYLGATLAQAIAGTLFNAQLIDFLEKHFGQQEIDELLSNGIMNLKTEAGKKGGPWRVLVLQAYNAAITKAFYVPLAGAAFGLLVAIVFFVKDLARFLEEYRQGRWPWQRGPVHVDSDQQVHVDSDQQVHVDSDQRAQ